MKKIVLVLTILFSTITLFAGPVDREQAYKNAQKFLLSQGRNAKLEKPLVSRGEASNQPYYIFNAENNQGYVIASGDDRTMQVLGFGNSGNIDVTNIPQNLKGLLDSYARQIKALGNSRFVTTSPAGSGKTDIVPLLTTTWNQGTPYNNSINISLPGASGKKPYTGCTATAMAQVINYYKYPDALVATIPSYTTETHKINVPEVPAGSTIDWDNMSDSYAKAGISDASKKAVADLMMYSSYSLESDFIDFSSGTAAYVNYVPMALVDYFGYDPTVRLLASKNYTISSWNDIIYNELAAGRPVLYGGATVSSGHAFVVDGYSSDGYYHINWGWEGQCDNYFLLYIANPDDTSGAGASSTEDGFSDQQEAVVGIQYGVDNTDLTCLEAYLDGFEYDTDDECYYINFKGYNLIPKSKKFDIGVAYYDTQNVMQVISSSPTESIDFMRGLRGYFLLPELPTGKNTLFAVSKVTGTDEWLRSGDLPSQTVVVNVAENKEITLSQPAFAKPDVEISFQGDKVKDQMLTAKVKVTANNQEYRGPIFLYASKTTTIPEQAEYQKGVELTKGSSDNIELYFTPKSAGSWNIWITNGYEYDGNAEKYVVPDKYILGQTSVNITESTGIESISFAEEKPVKNEPLYNIAGQKVNKNYKGLVVKNGKKEVFVK